MRREVKTLKDSIDVFFKCPQCGQRNFEAESRLVKEIAQLIKGEANLLRMIQRRLDGLDSIPDPRERSRSEFEIDNMRKSLLGTYA